MGVLSRAETPKKGGKRLLVLPGDHCGFRMVLGRFALVFIYCLFIDLFIERLIVLTLRDIVFLPLSLCTAIVV